MSYLTPTSELEAVNVLLRAINEAPVNSLEGTLPVDVASAVDTVREVSRDVQSRGWRWNTEVMTLAPDAGGRVLLPTNLLRATPTNSSDRERYVVRGDYLYNRDDNKNTFVFESPVELEVVLFLAFTDLPEAARRYTTLKAARYFQSNQLGSTQMYQMDAPDEMAALTLLQQEETVTSRFNMGTGSRFGRRMLDRRGLWRSY